MKFLASIVILIVCVSGINSQAHPCERPCNSNTRRMTCTYYLVADYYFTNQTDCRGCSKGIEADCYRKYCIPGDGRSRMVKAYNYTIPGPTIEVCEGDKLIVKVLNLLGTETTSIHWHGMHQIKTQNMDGVPMITQPPIQPNELYTYSFNANQVGTHFYHSHSGSQRADGCFGKLIVCDYNRPKPLAYHQDIHSISLLEWFPGMSDEMTMRYQRTGEFYDVNPPRSLLVDSQGHTSTNRVPPAKYTVKQGLKYRFRVIHAGNIVCPIEISIDDHVMSVFNSDGNDFYPVDVDSFTATNGERFDFVLHANKPIRQYTIRFRGSLICNTIGYAILHYEGATKTAINYTRTPNFNRRLNCVTSRTPGCIYYPDLTYFHDDIPRDLIDDDPDTMRSLYFDQYLFVHERFRGTLIANELYTPFINKVGFAPPRNTLLCTDFQETCNEYTVPPFSQCTHVVEIPSNAVIEIILIDEGKDLELSHPFHLHGYSFLVVAQQQLGNATTRDKVLSRYYNNEIPRNEYPILKDTVSVPDGGFTIIRFYSDNPGYWLLHCHVDFHTEEGMQLVIKTSDVPYPPDSCTCVI